MGRLKTLTGIVIILTLLSAGLYFAINALLVPVRLPGHNGIALF